MTTRSLPGPFGTDARGAVFAYEKCGADELHVHVLTHDGKLECMRPDQLRSLRDDDPGANEIRELDVDYVEQNTIGSLRRTHSVSPLLRLLPAEPLWQATIAVNE